MLFQQRANINIRYVHMHIPTYLIYICICAFVTVLSVSTHVQIRGYVKLSPDYTEWETGLV